MEVYPATNPQEKKNPHLFCAGKMVGNEKVIPRRIAFQGKNLSSDLSAARGLVTLSLSLKAPKIEVF